GTVSPGRKDARMTLQIHPPAAGPRALAYARQILHAEAAALRDVADRLDESFVRTVDLLAACRGRVAVTGVGKSAAVGGKIAGTVALVYGPVAEACPLLLAPSTSTTVMLALGDALAFALSDRRQFSAEQFARYHPAGSLGRRLTRVDAVMRRGPELRLASADE